VLRLLINKDAHNALSLSSSRAIFRSRMCVYLFVLRAGRAVTGGVLRNLSAVHGATISFVIYYKKKKMHGRALNYSVRISLEK
jgi:hypothetical protein